MDAAFKPKVVQLPGFRPGERWEFRLERMGDRWATLDHAREIESALYLREWRTELTYRLNTGSGTWPAVVLGVGASVDTRVSYRDRANGTVDLHLGNAILGSIRFGWQRDSPSPAWNPQETNHTSI